MHPERQAVFETALACGRLEQQPAGPPDSPDATTEMADDDGVDYEEDRNDGADDADYVMVTSAAAAAPGGGGPVLFGAAAAPASARGMPRMAAAMAPPPPPPAAPVPLPPGGGFASVPISMPGQQKMLMAMSARDRVAADASRHERRAPQETKEWSECGYWKMEGQQEATASLVEGKSGLIDVVSTLLALILEIKRLR